MSSQVAINPVRFLQSLSKVLGARVEVRPLPGRPPRPQPIDDLLFEPPTAPVKRSRPRRRKLRANLGSPRRRLAVCHTEEEARQIILEMVRSRKENPNAPKWEEATIRRYLPKHLKDIGLPEVA